MRHLVYWTGATAAFGAELAALAALAAWGFALPIVPVARIAAGVGVALAAAVVWGLFAAPRAPFHSAVLAVATAVLVLGGAVLALTASGHPRLAAVLATVIVAGQLLTSVASIGPTVARPLPTAHTPHPIEDPIRL
jgi:Protein of unknown function (DUF2568)